MTTTANTTGDEEVFWTDVMLAERWNMTSRTLRNWRVEGYGPKWVKFGGAVRYRFSEIIAWEADNEHSGTATQTGPKRQRRRPRADASAHIEGR